MVTDRADLVGSIANTIADYRGGTFPMPVSDHVERWASQFDGAVQYAILKEVNHVLMRTYFPKRDVTEFLRNVICDPNLVGDKPDRFWRSVNFLDIQLGGGSQSDILTIFSEQLKLLHGFGVKECGKGGEVFVYLDDGIFTGNRIRSDLESWVRDHAPTKACVHVICIAVHLGGRYYAERELKKVIEGSGKEVNINWWGLISLEDRRAYSANADVLRPTTIPGDSDVRDYVGRMRYKPTLRSTGCCGSNNLFSSDAAKILLEQEFLKLGVRIRNICPNLSEAQRPLGNMRLESLGFGSLIVTYRNCPNNAPLVFWVGSPWYPLFPRITNAQTAMNRLISCCAKGAL